MSQKPKRGREIKLETWQKAQKFEKQFWLQNRHRKIAQIDSKKKEAFRIVTLLEKFKTIYRRTRILEIECGPDGIINFLFGLRYAIDPLMTLFKKKFNSILDRNVEFCKGVGEQLPYPNEFFDVIILNNVLDHTNNPVKVLSEINRTLKSNGYFYLAVNTYSKLGYLLKTFILKKDYLHPHIYTKSSLTKQITKQTFTLQYQTYIPQRGKPRQQKIARLYVFIRDLLLNQKFLQLILIKD